MYFSNLHRYTKYFIFRIYIIRKGILINTPTENGNSYIKNKKKIVNGYKPTFQ